MKKTPLRLRVVIGEDEPDAQYLLQKALDALGHDVVGVAANGAELIDFVHRQRPDLVVADLRMPRVDGLEAARSICGDMPVPVIVVSAYQEEELLERAGDCPNVMAYLAKPVAATDLRPAIAVALKRFEQVQAVREEAADLRQALEDRKVIERAKGLLTRRLRLDEDEAFRRLRRAASLSNRKLADVAAEVLKADRIFQELEQF
jgi:response regulator NasT